MTPTLVRQPLSDDRARDWAEIQERMLVPLYDAVYERLEVGPGTRLLGLRCGSGLALLLAAARGAVVTGVEQEPTRLALARERLIAEPQPGAPRYEAELTGTAAGGPFNLITAFEPCSPGVLAAAAALAERGSPVVLAGWGPAERCAAAPALRVAARLAERPGDCWRPSGRDDLEALARAAGLRLAGSGRVACPFGYANTVSALRGLLSTGLYEAAIAATDASQVAKELGEALHPYRRADGTIWMPNVFRYVVALSQP